MPTGYTADLEKRKYDVKGWLKENLIRAMGVCVTLRDDGSMTQNEILKALKPSKEEPYHEVQLREARGRLAQLTETSVDKLQKTFEKDRGKTESLYKKSCAEHEEKRQNHEAATMEVRSLLKQARAENAGDVTIGTLEFALQQLEQSYQFDYGSGPYRHEILDQSFEQWCEARRKKALWDIDYHSKEAAKETSRNSDRYAEYKRFIEFVDSKGKDHCKGRL